MLYLDTFGATGGVGRCSIELLPVLARRLGDVVIAGRSHVVDSYWKPFRDDEFLKVRNLETPRFHPAVWRLRRLARTSPRSPHFTHALLDRAGIKSRNAQPVLINYPQELSSPKRDYAFDIFMHDLNWRHYPESFADAEEMDRNCAGWVRRAKRVFTNSDFTRREILDAYGVAPAHVISSPLAPPSSLSAPPLDAAAREKLRQLGLNSDGYFFYPSVHGFHKGHDVLAEALASTAAESILPVVITAPVPLEVNQSSKRPGYWEMLGEKLEELQRAGRIVALPNLPWEQVVLIAASARAYVLPSRFEGFGFPLVEAMALGKFCLCSEIPAYREILHRYGSRLEAATFPCGDAAALRELLIGKSRNMEVPRDRDGLREGCAPEWSWKDTAAAIVEAL